MEKSRSVGKFEIDMCTGAVLPKLLRFAVPMMVTNILQLMFAAADSIVVGRFESEQALAAVGATVSLINLLTNLFLGLSVGANVAAALYFGLERDDDLSETVHTSLVISAAIGVFLTAIGMLFTKQLLILMKTPAEILDLSVTYLRIYFLGMTAMTIYNFASALLRAVGDTKRPLIILLASGALNIVLNIIFVVNLRLGVVGVATSTVITQTLSAVIILICLAREKGAMKLIPSKLKVTRDKFIAIVRVGLPAGLQSSMYSISNVVIQASINGFDNSALVAANTAAVNLEDIVYFTLNAVMQAVTSFVGQNAGRHNYERIKKVMLIGLATVMLAGTTIIAIELTFAEQLIGIYTEDSLDVIRYGVERLWIVLPLYTLIGYMEVFIGGMRGLGSSMTPTIVSLLGVCTIRVVFLLTLFKLPQFHIPTAIYMLYPMTWIITSIAEGICFVVIYKRAKKNHELANI